jgi:2,3-dihydroxy-p-cumate/2,3-dihydroxybenzoate 3,4-dioxygenase
MSIRYSRLGYVALNVSSLERSEDFYTRLVGLNAVGSGPDGCRLLRCSDKHYDIVLHQSAVPGLKRVGFEMESAAALDALKSALRGAGVPFVQLSPQECADSKLRNCIRATIPHTGTSFDFYEAMREFGGRGFEPTVAKIQRLGHVVLKTDEYEDAVKFFTTVLNFRISDEVDGMVTFLRCFPNPFHHTFALGKAPRKLLHHVNLMVTEVDDIGKAIWRFQRAKVPVVNGPGRHPPSGSMFYYFLDPDGLTVEYSFGMEEFAEHQARKPRVLEPVRESIDYWGADVDQRKAAVGEIETDAKGLRGDQT